MILNIYFEKTDKVIDFNNQHQMNGFIFNLLGEHAGKYHDSFSNYSISSIQGGKMSTDKKGIVFEDRPYIQVASNDLMFLNEVAEKVADNIDGKNKANFFNLHIEEFTGGFSFTKNDKFDIVKTISPILLKNKDGRKVNIKDTKWCELLEENCRKKLTYEGIEDPSFRIEIKKPEVMKTKMVWVGKIFNPCTEGVFTVYGSKKTREHLYSMGLGNSTGTGFGAVQVLKFGNDDNF